MRAPLAALCCMLLSAATAQAATLTTTTRTQPVASGVRVLSGRAPQRFTLVGVQWQGQGTVTLRTRRIGGRWSEWRLAQPEPGDGPDAVAGSWHRGNPWWTGPSNRIQYRVAGDVRRVRTRFVWTDAPAVPLRRLALADSPAIVPRAGWAGPNDRLRRGRPRYAAAVRFVLVHHTAGATSYSRAQSPAIVRAIAAYHVRGNGWDDVGYNFLIDRYGQIFEGRYGGIDRNVIGAHAQGFNDGSVGIALIGSYGSTAPTAAARAALARLIAWRLDVAHVDPLSTVTQLSGGNPRYSPGVPVVLRAVSGHRDAYPTSCPGNRLYAELPAIARTAAATGGPKLYAPVVRGTPGALVRFRARLSSPQPWTVSVSDDAGGVVATGAGTGAAVDWTWDARTAAFGRYSWTIGAPRVRPATGVLTGGLAGLTVTASAQPSTISPDGDGRADVAVLHYRLGRSANLTVDVLDSNGAVVQTLFAGPAAAGAHDLWWGADGLADGAYQVLFTALGGAGEVSTVVPVSVNRTLRDLIVTPRAFSPNADGRQDAVSIRFTLTTPADVSVIAGRAGVAPISILTGPLAAGPAIVSWSGEAVPGQLARDGTYSVSVRAANGVGVVVQSSVVALDTAAPRVALVSRPTMRVRVSEPGTLVVSSDGVETAVPVARPGVVRVPASGARVSVYAVDRAGNRSRSLRLR